MINADEEVLIQNFMSTSGVARSISKKLYDSFMHRGIISDETTLFELMAPHQKYVDFMSALLNKLSLNLSNDIEASDYGLGKVSNFDIYHNFSTVKSRTNFLLAKPELAKILSAGDNIQLASNSLKLRRWVIAQRRALISHWDLPDGGMQSAKKAKTPHVATHESVASDVNATIEKVALQRTTSREREILEEGKA